MTTLASLLAYTPPAPSASESAASAFWALVAIGIVFMFVALSRSFTGPPRRHLDRPPIGVQASYITAGIPADSYHTDLIDPADEPSHITEPRRYIAVATNTCDHPYDELPLTELHDHLFQKHFEVYNLLGEKNPVPQTWRRNHAADHGLEIVR